MKISIANKSVLFSAVVVGSFFKWHGERFQKTAEWVDDNKPNVLCIDAKRTSRFGENDEVTPVDGGFEYVDDVLTFVEKGITFASLTVGQSFLLTGDLYTKISASTAYSYATTSVNTVEAASVVEPRTISVSAE